MSLLYKVFNMSVGGKTLKGKKKVFFGQTPIFTCNPFLCISTDVIKAIKPKRRNPGTKNYSIATPLTLYFFTVSVVVIAVRKTLNSILSFLTSVCCFSTSVFLNHCAMVSFFQVCPQLFFSVTFT